MSEQSISIPATTVAAPAPAAATARPVAARTKLLLEGSVFATLLRLAAPNILNLVAFVGVIIFDGFFLGKIGTNALAGASLAFPWIMIMLQTTNSGMGAGVSSAVARALGAGQRDKADELTFHAFVLALALAGIFSTALLLAAPLMFGWMGGRDTMLIDALAYANVAFGGAVCITVLNLLGNAVRGTGNMTLPAVVLVGCVIAHIAISPVLIFGYGPLPALGPAGAGWGLVLPFGVGSLIMIAYLRSPGSIVRLNFYGVTPRWALFADILKVGVPGLLNTAITNLSVIVLTGIAGQFGPKAAVGYAMGARLEYIMQPIAFGFGTAIVAMVGTNWGAQQYGRARRIAWSGASTIALICGALGLIVAARPASGSACSAPMPKWRASARRICESSGRLPCPVLRMPRIRPRLYGDAGQRSAVAGQRRCRPGGSLLVPSRYSRSVHGHCRRLLCLCRPDRARSGPDFAPCASQGAVKGVIVDIITMTISHQRDTTRPKPASNNKTRISLRNAASSSLP